jgi:hypothetical protein
MLVRALPVIALLALSAVPAASAAPTLTADRACYSMDRDQALTLTGTGFTPFGDVAVLITGRHAGVTVGAIADASGNLKVNADVPYLDELGFEDTLREQVTASAVDLTRIQAVPPDGANGSASVSFTITDWGVDVAPWDHTPPAPGHPRRMTTFNLLGWTWVHGRPIYAHYVKGGKLVHTVRLAVPQGPCGDGRVDQPEFPFRPVHPGIYSIQFDATAAYHRPGYEYSHYYRQVRVAPKDAVR